MCCRLFWRAVAMTSTFVLGACGSNGTPAAPPAPQAVRSLQASNAAAVPNVAGSYQGEIFDNKNGEGAIAIGISQSGSTLKAFIAAQWKVAVLQAKVSGTVSSTGKISLSGKGCDGKWTGAATAKALNGSYTLLGGCTGHKGRFTTTKVKKP